MIQSINDFKNVFFIGVAGTGMSAIAQYLKGIGKEVSGSDRYFHPNEPNETKEKLEAEGIRCFLQNGEGITTATDLVVVSTAVEDTVEEVIKAKQLNIPIIKRAELLAVIARSKKTIAVGGTSGKSTTSAMLFDILQHAGLEPSIISGAGLTSIIKEGKIGNAKVGSGDWLVIEADESDGSFLRLDGTIAESAQPVDTLRVVPAAEFELRAQYALTRWLGLGLRGGLSLMLRPQRYLVRGEPVLELARTAFEAGLELAVALPD